MADAENGQAAGESQQAPAQGQQTEPAQGQQTDPIDWEAKYNDLKAQSRKWEARAKENGEKAKKYDEIEQAKKTEAEKAAEALNRAAEAEKAAEEAKARLELMEVVQKVSQETKVPAALLKGSTEEELKASAKALLEFAGSAEPSFPGDQGGAGTLPPITQESLKDIKNPIERINGRMALNSLVN